MGTEEPLKHKTVTLFKEEEEKKIHTTKERGNGWVQVQATVHKSKSKYLNIAQVQVQVQVQVHVLGPNPG